MEELILRILAFAVAGYAAGLLSGLFGIGGGIVNMPLFIYLMPQFGVDHRVLMHMALGTSVALIIPTTLAAVREAYAEGRLDLAYFRVWALGLLAGVMLGNLLLPFLSTEMLKAIFVVFMLVLCVYEGFVPDRIVVATSPPRGLRQIGVAAGIGCSAALTGTAGGAITTPVLKAFSTPLRNASAIGIAGGLVVGLVSSGGAIFNGWETPGRPAYSLGYIDLPIFLAMLPTSMLGAPFGVKIGNALSKVWMQRLYALLLFVVAVDMARSLMT